MAIDTDDLTDETYKAILSEAEGFHHDLTLQFGLLSYKSDNEKDFIKRSKSLINKMMKYKADDWDAVFFANPPDKTKLYNTLKQIVENINRLGK